MSYFSAIIVAFARACNLRGLGLSYRLTIAVCLFKAYMWTPITITGYIMTPNERFYYNLLTIHISNLPTWFRPFVMFGRDWSRVLAASLYTLENPPQHRLQLLARRAILTQKEKHHDRA